MCSPLAATTAQHRVNIDKMSRGRRTRSWGMAAHSSSRASLNSASMAGSYCRARSLLSSSFQRCSMIRCGHTWPSSSRQVCHYSSESMLSCQLENRVPVHSKPPCDIACQHSSRKHSNRLVTDVRMQSRHNYNKNYYRTQDEINKTMIPKL